MRRFASGEARAFEALYRRYELRVFRYLLRHVRNPSLAEDLLQEVWFAVARDAPRYVPLGRFSAWLFTLAHHRMMDAFRASRPEVSWEALNRDDPLDSRPAPAGESPDAAVLAGEQLAVLLSALEELPAEQRDAFLLQQEGGLSVEEIASAAGCSFETAKSRLRYARTKLRERLGEIV